MAQGTEIQTVSVKSTVILNLYELTLQKNAYS